MDWRAGRRPDSRPREQGRHFSSPSNVARDVGGLDPVDEVLPIAGLARVPRLGCCFVWQVAVADNQRVRVIESGVDAHAATLRSSARWVVQPRCRSTPSREVSSTYCRYLAVPERRHVSRRASIRLSSVAYTL